MSQNYRLLPGWWDHKSQHPERDPEAFEAWRKSQRVSTGRYGYHNCGWFCSIHCGFWWAVQVLDRVHSPPVNQRKEEDEPADPDPADLHGV